MAENIRSFIAVSLNDEAHAALRRLQDSLCKGAEAQASRWTPPESIHLTLKFLGDVPASRLPDIAEAMRQACRGHRPFAIALAGLGCFPNYRRPRVAWVGVTGDIAALQRLQEAIEEAMAALGYPLEGRAFSPHLTIARLQRRASAKEVEAFGRLIQGTVVGEIARLKVDRVYLMRSDLKPSGAIYTKLAMAELA